MAVSYDQREVLDLLLDRALAVAETRSSDAAVNRQLVCVRLLVMVEAVRGAGGRRVTLPGGGESQHSKKYTLLSVNFAIFARCRLQ